MLRLYQPLIVDTDSDTVHALRQHLESSGLFAPAYQADSLSAAYQFLHLHPIDLILMEAELAGKPTFELLALVPSHPPVVVISSLFHYAMACFDLDIADFVPKPLEGPRLYRAIGRALPLPTANQQDEEAPPTLPGPNQHMIYLKVGRKTERFMLENILYLETAGLYVKVHTAGPAVIVNEKISALQKRLPENQFIRIHKSYVVNIMAITAIETKALLLDQIRLGIGVTFQDTVHNKLRELVLEQ